MCRPVWKGTSNCICICHIRARVSGGASARTLHVEGNILCWDYARAPFLPLGAARARTRTLRNSFISDTIAITCQHNNMTHMRRALLNSGEEGSEEQREQESQKRLLFQGSVYSPAEGGAGGRLQATRVRPANFFFFFKLIFFFLEI